MSVCHWHACRCRTGGPFWALTRFAASAVTTDGGSRVWERIADSDRRACHHRCPGYGATVFSRDEGHDDIIAVPSGALDGDLPRPTASIFERRPQDWLAIVGAKIDYVA